MKEEKEVWKPVRNYEGLYEVSNMGRVKSLNYRHTGKERILKTRKNRSGYVTVNLYQEGKMKTCTIHKLVGQEFLENPMGYTELNHLDEDKENNRADNLEFCSRSYNINHGTRNKRVAEKVSEKLRGRKQTEEHIKKRAEKMTNNPKLSKPVICINKVSGLIVEFPSLCEASRQTGISLSHIWECCKGRRKSAGGHIFFYADDDDNE